jgi:hypothetical protein
MLVEEIVIINKKLKHKKDLKVIKKEAMKFMIEGPPINITSPFIVSKGPIDQKS